MSPANPTNGDNRDPFAFLNVLRDPGGASSLRLPGLPGLEDSDDEDAHYGADFDDPDEIPGESPNTSPSTLPGHGHSQDIDDDEEDMSEGERKFGRERRRREAEGSDDDGQGEHGYELRRNINREAFVGSGYTDWDQPGNYSPEEESGEELEMERTCRGRKRLSDRRRDKNGKGKAKPRRSSSRVGANDDAEKDDGTRDAVDNAVDAEVAAMDNLDLDGASQSPAAEEEDGEDEDDDISIERMCANSDVDPDELRLRKAAKKRMPPKPKKNTYAPSQSPQSCTSCKKLRLDCSIDDEPGSYPCLNCLEQKCGCILPIPYTTEQRKGSRKAATKQRAVEKKERDAKAKKDRELIREHELRISDLKRAAAQKKRFKACTQCKELDKKCSNEDLEWDEVRGRQCKRCVKNHTICELDLRARREAERPDPVREEEGRPLPRGQRPLPSFASAQFDVQDKEDDHDIGDPFERVTHDGEQPRKRSRKSKKKTSELQLNQSPGEAFVPSQGYAKKQITTNFAHPLVFNAPFRADDEEEDGTICDMHTVAFSIFGHPLTKPWVYYPSPYPSALTISSTFSYREIPGTGGHTESTEQQKTNVCKVCTFSRQKILFCPSHILSGIKNLPKPKDFDFDAAYGPLLADQEHNFRTNDARYTKWCSICPAPAFLECCAKSPLNLEKGGCGLMLCEICAVSLLTGPGGSEEVATREVQMLLRDVKKVNLSARQALLNHGQPVRERAFVQVRRELDDVIAEAKEMCENGGGKGGKYMDGVRADVELISRRGWLWEWMSNEAERQRHVEWSRTGIASAGRGAANVAPGGGTSGASSGASKA